MLGSKRTFDESLIEIDISITSLEKFKSDLNQNYILQSNILVFFLKK